MVFNDLVLRAAWSVNPKIYIIVYDLEHVFSIGKNIQKHQHDSLKAFNWTAALQFDVPGLSLKVLETNVKLLTTSDRTQLEQLWLFHMRVCVIYFTD